jgi:hypothetical protein
MTITINSLIQSLRIAGSNPEAHAPAQLEYFSELQEDSVLVNCGTACCIAGDLMLKAHADNLAAQVEILDSIEMDPYDWVQNALGLSNLESTLAFEPNTHYELHLLLADLLEAGLRLPDVDYLAISPASTYTEFHWARLEDEDMFMGLNDLKSWMVSIARCPLTKPGK